MRVAFLVLLAAISHFTLLAQSSNKTTSIEKLEDIVIYSDDRFHSAFPSIVRRPDGELLVAFRRAPERRVFGESSTSHTDPNSYLMLVRSKDDGRTWSKEPELIWANPFGGSQDPCMLQLNDGTILCASYSWALLKQEGVDKLKKPFVGHGGGFVFLGGFLVRSKDGGDRWEGPIIPLHCEADVTFDPFGQPIPAFNRGALVEGKNGRIYWAVAATDRMTPRKSSVHLMVSDDMGLTWNYSAPIAVDDKVTFNETSLYETPNGDLVAFMRTGNFNDHTCIARSTDGGKTFQKWEDAGFRGHPHYALRLPDQRVLLVYGYRHAPIGIRARVLNPECTDFATAEEIVLRDDGGNGDIGYPWATMIGNDRALVVYYFNKANGTRHIAGTFLKIK